MRRVLITFVSLLLFKSIESNAQRGNQPYWQQHVDYKIDLDVDVSSFRYSGDQKLIYTNNSPDTLKRVYFHLFYNAFQPESEMDQRSRSIKDPDSRVLDRISKLNSSDQGYLKVVNLKQDGSALNGLVAGTILEVELNKPISPGKKTTFEMSFTGQVPLMVRRAGKNSPEGVKLSMAQWYPKLAEYDYEGWHADPYIGREFYGVWGDFDVTINIDKNYIVGGTGYLQKSDFSSKTKKKWRFKAPMVHDFTWAADPDFIHDTRLMENGTVLNFYYKRSLSKEYKENWKKLQLVTEKLMLYFNKNIGTYPYKQYSVIQGGDGGMEYGMCTLITGERKFESLVGVTAHELAHSWFHFVLASNESKHEWMDEGFTEYYGTHAEEEIMGLNEELYYEGTYKRYRKQAVEKNEQPQTTHADRYMLNSGYSTSAYVKGYIFLKQLRVLLGNEAYEKTMKKYYNDWSFKHPSPNDFIRCAEIVSGSELDWYIDDWTKTTNNIDYKVVDLENKNKGCLVKLERIGLMPFPLDVLLIMEDGSEKKYHIPLRMMRKDRPLEVNINKLEDWPWTNPYYGFFVSTTKQVLKVSIDPENNIADINRKNNTLTNENIE